MLAFGAVVASGLGAFGFQGYFGIGVWGLHNPVFWAFDITNFVFWIGISHAGTLISAILRLVDATGGARSRAARKSSPPSR